MYANNIYSFLLFISATDLSPTLIQLNLINDSKSRVVQPGLFGVWDSNYSSWPKQKLQIKKNHNNSLNFLLFG